MCGLSISAKMKTTLSLASYCAFFILAPSAGAYYLAPPGWKLSISIALFFCLCVAGEHALRHWARI